MTIPSKWKPTTRELAQLKRIYEPLGQVILGTNGRVMIRRGGRVR